MMYLLGWGMASCPDPDNNPGCTGGADPEVLQEIQLPVAPQARCKEAVWRGRLETSEFCFGGNLGFGACFGDSGSPLMATSERGGRTQYILAGSVEGGTRQEGGCGQEGNYGTAWETAKYLDWYTRIVGDGGQGDQVLWCNK